MNTYSSIHDWMDMPIMDMLDWHNDVQESIKESQAQAEIEAGKHSQIGR